MLSKLFHLGVIIKTYFHLRFPSKGVLNVLPTYNNFPPQNSFDTPPTLMICRVQTQISGILSTRSSLPRVLILLFNQYFRLVLIIQPNGSTVLIYYWPKFGAGSTRKTQNSGITRSANIKLLLLLHDSFI